MSLLSDFHRHISVLGGDFEPSVFTFLEPRPGETVIDATLGLAGHAERFLKQTGPDGRLIGLDADEKNLALAKERLAPFGDRVAFIHANFAAIASLDLHCNILFVDLGVSSPHFDDPSRGFTFRHDAPLDLRYDQTRGKTAAEWLGNAREEEIARVLREYGELSGAGRLALCLRKRAAMGKLATTTDVRVCAEEIFAYKAPQALPQIFQAFRIHVNGELDALQSLLAAIPQLLTPGGRAGIISYHSLEDRLVKQAFKLLCTDEKNELTGAVAVPSPFVSLTKKAVVPSEAEIAANPRARSARFRAIRRRELPTA
jgi:16S rRNA (cytosine1402-N4)-methyltransferase